jgi:UDP-2-acetamido-3-amino-2,3-dideoxy-glucuronate N-acetyltransferase
MNHVRTWHSLGLLHTACDPDPVRIAAVRREFGDVRTADSIDDVVTRDDIDAVVVATPAPTHARLALEAIAHGKDVLVEKPLATEVADADALIESAEARDRVLMVGHVLEYHPAFLRLRQLIAEGVLGRLLYLYSHRLNLGRVRTEESAMWSFAPHDLALCLRIVGDLPSSVSCRGGEYLSTDVADVTLMGLSFPNDVQAHIFVSWLHPFKEHRFVVVGDRQMGVFDDTAPWPSKLVLYPHRVDWLHGRVPVAHKAEAVPVPVTEAEPLRAECEHFAQAVRTRARVLTDGRAAADVLRILEAGERSMHADGSPVRLSTASPRCGIEVHPTATVDAGAMIGDGTRIWHYTHVMPEANIGRDCSLGQNVFIGQGVKIGDRVRIQNNVSVYEGVEIEEAVFCGPSVVFTNVLNPRADVDRKHEYRTTRVCRGASLGANSTIVCGVTIGQFAFVGAGAVVTKDVPAHALVIGVPATVVGWVCRCGTRFEPDGTIGRCPDCGAQYSLGDDYVSVRSSP